MDKIYRDYLVLTKPYNGYREQDIVLWSTKFHVWNYTIAYGYRMAVIMIRIREDGNYNYE